MDRIESVGSRQYAVGGSLPTVYRLPPTAYRDAPARRDLTVRLYQVRLATLDEKSRSIENVLATENQVQVFDLRAWEVIDEVLLMSGARFAPQVVHLDTHDRSSIDKVLGSTRNIRVESAELVGRNFYSSTPEGERAFTKVREGHVTDSSIGYRVLNSVNIDPGKTANVSGKNYTAGQRRLRVTLEWELVENSLVPMGADQFAKLRNDGGIPARGRGASPAARTGQEDTMETFREWLTQRGLALADLTEAQRAALQKDFEAEQARGAAPPASETVPPLVPAPVTPEPVRTPAATPIGITPEQAVAAERSRVSQIRQAGAGLDADVVQRAIDEGTSLDAARARFLEAFRSRAPAAPAIHAREEDAATQVRAMTAGLVLRQGGAHADFLVSDRAGAEGAASTGLRPAPRLRIAAADAERGDQYRDMSLIDLARAALVIEGRHIPHGRDEIIRAAFSTQTLANVLGTSAQKVMLAGYELSPATCRRWVRIGSLSDFKKSQRIMLSEAPQLLRVNSAGEIELGAMKDSAEEYRLYTYGRRFAITREMMINDDLGAFLGVPAAFGEAANRQQDDLVYAALLDNAAMSDSVALFEYASHANYLTGTATILDDATALKNARVLLAKQKGLNGAQLNLQGESLLVPPELGDAARTLVRSQQIISSGGAAPLGNANVYEGRYGVIEEARLSNSAFHASYSTTAWYLLPNARLGPVELGFLRGRQTPTLEQVDLNGVLGVAYQIYIDLGVKAVDWRTAVKNKGA